MRSQEHHFDGVAHEYDGTLPPHVVEHLLSRRTSLAAELLGDGGCVLDVGCGTGVFIERLARGPYECHGVDVSDAMVAEARRRGLEVVKAPAEELPFESDSFDLVTSIAVMHHLIDPKLVGRAIAEMVRVGRPGGRVLIWDHNPLNPYWPILMRRLPQDRGDEKLVRAGRLAAGLRAAGVTDLTIRRATFVPEFVPARRLKLAATLERTLERVPGLRLLAAHNVVLGRVP